MKVLSWTTVSEYVDGETGEVISKYEALKNYRIIKKKKHAKVIKKVNMVTKEEEGRGEITITNICTKNGKQQRLFEY